MRCKTPITRVSLMGAPTIAPVSLTRKKGNQYIRYPNMKMSIVRFKIFLIKTASLICLYLSKEKDMALPTAKRNDGKTRSVGVKPCHAACCRGAKGAAPLPGVFTIIIKQMVIPRKTSSDKKRCETLFTLSRFKRKKI